MTYLSRKTLLVFIAVAVLPGCAPLARQPDIASLRQQVSDSERAFARSMAQRDHASFTSFLADEAVFFSGETPIRGKQAVAADWSRFFEGSAAPFSWEPDHVELLGSGSLALSTGPVYDPAGRIIGRFNSIWRREASGQWRVVLDKGSPVCKPGEPAPAL